jgi:glutamyl-tRNA synthetase
MDKEVRVRFAPSPTGYLHVGGARTALFNWLFARHWHGKFILRIEDTDFARSSQEMTEGILAGLRWLGLDWDEGPYYQSRKIEQHRTFANQLLEEDKAYRCFCKAVENKNPENGHTDNRFPDSNNHGCAHLPIEESRRKADGGEPFALRFRTPPGLTLFHDQVFGDIEVENDILEDFVLLRSDGIPTYHLVVVADDIDMGITHVIRGADHISNTPKQILLYQATGKPSPEFAHLPLILGPDKQRLSKRHGATSVTAYAEMGYLSDAFFNFLSLLGWSPGDDRELLSRQELIELFSLHGVGKADAVFGLEKLDWFNSQYLRNIPFETLRQLVVQELTKSGIAEAQSFDLQGESLDAKLTLLRPRLRNLSDFKTVFKAYFSDDFEYDPAACEKFLKDPKLRNLIPLLRSRYIETETFSLRTTEEILRKLAEQAQVKAGLLINAARIALTGQGVAPGLFEVMLVLGRERTIDRLHRLEKYIDSNGA